MLQLQGGVALQASLDGFFMALREQVEITREVTKSAFCQARQKFNASAFVALNKLWLQGWQEAMPAPRWRGLRVVAADATCVRVPKRAENVAAYGKGPSGDGSAVMARCVALFCTAGRQFLDVTVGRYDEGERALLLRCLGVLKEDDILVLDRGYPAWWLFAALAQKKLHFCARIENCSWPTAQQLMRSLQDELIVHHTLKSQSRKALRELGLPAVHSVCIRLVKVPLPNGKFEVLATSLLDEQRYPATGFGALYHKRWAIEEAFKTIKHHLDLEGFSGELAHCIEQDIQAKILMYNITLGLCAQAQSLVPQNQAEDWQVNHAYAVKHLGRVIVSWFKGCGDELVRVTQSLVETLAQTLEKIRPDRSFERCHSTGGAQRPRKAYR